MPGVASVLVAPEKSGEQPCGFGAPTRLGEQGTSCPGHWLCQVRPQQRIGQQRQDKSERSRGWGGGGALSEQEARLAVTSFRATVRKLPSSAARQAGFTAWGAFPAEESLETSLQGLPGSACPVGPSGGSGPRAPRQPQKLSHLCRPGPPL